MNKPFIRSPYNYDADKVSDFTGLSCSDPSRTKQEFKDDSNPNELMKTFARTGLMPQLSRIPLNEDFVDLVDYQSAMNQLIETDKLFEQLPATLRKRFANDPDAFVKYCSDKDNHDEMRKLGLLKASQTVPEAPDSPSAPPPVADVEKPA